MKTVQPYSVVVDDRNGRYPRPTGVTPEGINFYIITMPEAAYVMSSGFIGETLYVRAIIDDEKTLMLERRIAILQDGSKVPSDSEYIGTVEFIPRTEPFSSRYGTYHIFDLGYSPW